MKMIEIPDIKQLTNVTSDTIKSRLNRSIAGLQTSENENANDMFDVALDAAIDNINTTNGYISDQENEELKLAMGLTDSTHDLTIAIQKAESALQYTIAVRDKLLEAYQEIMNMQI